MQIKWRLEWCVSFSLSLFLRKASGFSPYFSLRCFKLKRKSSTVKRCPKGSNCNGVFTSSRSKSGSKDSTGLGDFLMQIFLGRAIDVGSVAEGNPIALGSKLKIL